MSFLKTTTTPKPRVFVLTSRVYEIAGGRTKATVQRVSFLQKYFDTTLIEMSSVKYPGEELPAVFAKYDTTFATTNPWTGSRQDDGRKKNYLDYVRRRTGGLGDPALFEGAQKDFILPTLAGGRIKAYTDNGAIARLREYHASGHTEFFALDDQQNIFLHEHYEGERLTARHYLDSHGVVTAGFTTGENDGKQYVYRTRDGKFIYSDTLDAHNATFLQDILQPGDIVISDVRYYDEILAQLPSSIQKVHVWHEIAVDTTGKKTNPPYQAITNTSYPLSQNDKIVVFTDDAEEEYSRAFPHLANHFAVIPYGTDIKTPAEDTVRDAHTIISIGRLEKQKDVFAQVNAFALFHKEYPATRLKIFGDGSDKPALQELADKLGLHEAVVFCGFSNDVNREYQRAAMMVFSSRYETFGLTVMESLSNGTPVASYDVRYGTKAMLKDRKNGMVARSNTPESLAEAMIKLYKLELSPEKVKRSIAHLSRANFEKSWVSLITNCAKGKR